MAESTVRSFVCRFAACVVAAGMLAASCRPASSSDDRATPQESKGQRPTAAFLELGGSPLAALLEGRLLENSRAAWLERNAIEEIRREQKLAALMDAAAGPQRVTIGKLLKADLLVLLRHFDAPKEHVELVVCETERGLRLAVHRVVVTANVEADVRQLTTLVEQAIAKHGQEIREICAVPPFVSNDLTYEHEHLKAAYARLVEQTVRDRPGLLTVELEEARAIAREVGLAGDEIRRPMPLYLLGEFRHEGQGEKQKATLRMRVMRGERELASREATGLSPADAAGFVQRASGELIDKTLGVRPAPPNSQVEAQQLARRAETFHLLGAWDEAAALAEASLLLDPKQMRMHQIAASSLAALARPAARWEYKKDPETIIRGVRLYLRALEHYEVVLPSVGHVSDRSQGYLYGHMQLVVVWPQLLDPPASPDISDVAAELYRQELEIYRRIILSRCKMGTGDEHRFLWSALRFRPEQEQFDVLLEIVRAIRDLPDAERLVRELSLHFDNTVVANTSILDGPAGRRYLESLATIDNEHVQRAVQQLRDLIAQEAGNKRQPQAPVSPPPRAGPQLVRFEPLEADLPPSLLTQFKGWIPAGDGVDLVWNSQPPTFWLMKEPGRLRRVWESEGVVDSVDFDGRFIWVTVWRPLGQKPLLAVLDPQQERVWEIDEDDGLPIVAPQTIPNPRQSQRLWIVGIAPGRALLISHFGRMTISNIAFDSDKGAKTHVFFEARVQKDPTDPEPWRNPQMAFQPRCLLGFERTADDGKPQRRVLVGGRHGYSKDWPILVDPDTGKVTVLEAGVGPIILPERVARTPEAVFRVQNGCLYRIGFPDFRPQILLRDVPEGHCVERRHKILVFGSKCWQIDPAAEPQQRVRVLADRLPWRFADFIPLAERLREDANEGKEKIEPLFLKLICRSNHFGLLAVREETKHLGEGNFTTVKNDFFRIVFDNE